MKIPKLNPLNIEYLKNKAKEREYQKGKCKNLKSSIKRARNILKILEKCDFKCKLCGSDKDLTVDHINGRKFAKYDNYKKYKPDKCIILCINCHNKKNKFVSSLPYIVALKGLLPKNL